MNLPTEVISAAVSILLTVFFSAKAFAVEVVDDLKLVQLIFRHGDRAPLHTYKNDPYPGSMWANGMGRLTKIGMEQQFEAGKFYRLRYSKFLDISNGPNEVYIRSSDADRTLQSAAAFSAGLFPPSTETQWNDGLGKNWRPVSIHTVPWEQETLLTKNAPCPAYSRLDKEVSDLPEARRLYKANHALFNFVVNASGEAAPDRKAAWETLSHVRDAVFCQQSNGKLLPGWMNASTYANISLLSNIYFQMHFGGKGDRLRPRIQGGNLLALVLKRMADKIHNASSAAENCTKAFIYSAHDTTVAGLLSTLELYNSYNTSLPFLGIPKYTGAVLIELFRNDTVRISLKNDPLAILSSEPQVLRHPRCDVLCPFDKLVKETQDYVVDDWDKECRSGEFGAAIDVDDVTIALITVVLVIILTTFALGCYRRRSQKKKSPLLGNNSSSTNGSRPDSSQSVTYSRLNQEEASL